MTARHRYRFLPFAVLALAGCAARVPAASPPGAPAPAAAAAGAAPASPLTPRAALERYYPQILAGGMPATDVVLLVVSPGGRVMKHALLHTMQGTTGVQIEQQLQPFGTGIANVNIIKTKPGELGPTTVNIAWADLSYEPSEPEAP
ncbi:hypothetical protein [Longimicrobium sp.]|uniref:hypothetical protein n=1 Tax=Longimicrobium sp. TaxID=2029185 RepID=UPI002C6677C4|nr:hypothetical protein [Longimicrobium sp.]HSU15993.1 hypothetical protein [Longimicrobium sp.]